jgi:spermidine/putrescine ABC transporter ATP-binding subunit
MLQTSGPGTMISVVGVSKHFGPVRAVDDVSLDIAPNEFFAILGASGSGKTTLLRILAGFEIPTSGEIFVDGDSVADVLPNRRPTNMVFQNYAIFPHLNVAENIAYGLLNKGLSRHDMAAEVERMLELIRLPGYGKRAAHQLSGGERQRVALARALVCQPKVLLLDEPLGALDKKLREQMQFELRAIQRKVGITFVFVTHDQEEALTLSDRIAVMEKGRIIQVDTPSRLYERPRNMSVAQFIGNINLFPGRVSSAGDAVLIDAGPAGTLQGPSGEARVSPGDAVALAVRPEKLTLATERPGPGFNGVRGQLTAESYAGDRSYYLVEAPGLEKEIKVVDLNKHALADRPAVGGKGEVWAVWPVDSGVLLTA